MTQDEPSIYGIAGLIAVGIGLFFGARLLGYENFLGARPMLIEADGERYVTCGTYNLSGGGLFGDRTLSFKDATTGGKVTLTGVRKIVIAEMPAETEAPMPANLPPVSKGYDDGTPFREGVILVWRESYPNGRILGKSMVRNGQWVSVMESNPVCQMHENSTH